MNIKYIGMDVHKETISIAVMNSDGKVVMESIIETKASTILQSIQGKRGNKSDKIDARKLADLLRGGYLRSVYHGENGLRTLKELARSYLTISKDLTRVMNRVKALYRSWGILCGGQQVLHPASSHRVVEQDWRSGRPPAGRVFLPTARCSARVAPSGAEGSVGRGSQTA